MSPENRLHMIAIIIENVDDRCMVNDGTVPTTMQEMTQDEMSEIYAIATNNHDPTCGSFESTCWCGGDSGVIPPMQLDDNDRCCGRKTLVYKREHKYFCHKCDRAFDMDTKKQIENWAWKKSSNGFIRNIKR